MIDDSSLQQEMGEMAALPPDDPRRQALEHRLVSDQTSADQEWRDLLLENECFRDNLPKVDVPDDLEHRLLAVVGNASRRRVSARWGWGLAAAAVALIVLGTDFARRYTAARCSRSASRSTRRHAS